MQETISKIATSNRGYGRLRFLLKPRLRLYGYGSRHSTTYKERFPFAWITFPIPLLLDPFPYYYRTVGLSNRRTIGPSDYRHGIALLGVRQTIPALFCEQNSIPVWRYALLSKNYAVHLLGNCYFVPLKWKANSCRNVIYRYRFIYGFIFQISTQQTPCIMLLLRYWRMQLQR